MAPTNTRRTDAVVWGLIVAGLVLRVRQFTGGAALWLDEIAVARSIVGRGYGALLSPLDYGQVAPAGYLLVERALWAAFDTDWSLRVVAFVGAVASLFLMRALARRIVTGVAVPLAVGAVAVGMPFLMYGAQVKQYSSDVAITLCLVLLAVRLLDAGADVGRRYAIAGITGFIAVWFSNAAVFVVAGCGAALALIAWRHHSLDRRRLALYVLVPWVVGAGAASLVAKLGVSPATMAYMNEFWKSAFAPLPPHSAYEASWPWRALVSVFGMPRGLRYRFAPVYVVLSLVGFVLLWRRKPDQTLVVLAPIVVVAGAAVAHLYPFEERLVLFLAPLLLLAAAAAAAEASRLAGRRAAVLGVAVVVAVSYAPVERIVLQHPLYRIQEMPALLEWLAARRSPGDAVYVWYRAVPNATWYGGRHKLVGDVMDAGCWVAEPRNFLRDIDRLRGRRRVWLIMAGGSFPEARLLRQYADSIGSRVESVRIATNVPGYFPLEAWAYDFSDPSRLANASASNFPVDLPDPGAPAVLSCTAGPWAQHARAVTRQPGQGLAND